MKHPELSKYDWLSQMYRDDYYPNAAVDAVRDVLIQLCEDIESKEPKTLEELYVLSHAATNKINDIQDDKAYNETFDLETMARECIAMEFFKIAEGYGFDDADAEELIGTRDW